ncbi:hypothetical protein NDU88_004931 [Pleurodeles waltl]|uniref:Uncharacterized protein n=1 Tax=Pleurodeles waltl TaxID=8319 RepID=A0AAV7QHE1_PLEWA|nr:hypothetical protein NDU88_004931 [Pleurodeles waltl]
MGIAGSPFSSHWSRDRSGPHTTLLGRAGRSSWAAELALKVGGHREAKRTGGAGVEWRHPRLAEGPCSGREACVARLEVSGDAVRTPLNTEEPSRAELLAAIQGSRVALEEEVWRWLEMWDKVVQGRTEGSGGIPCRASGAEIPDWRLHGTGRLVDSRHRVEIQQDGTMAVVPAESVGGTALEHELGAGGDSGMT